MIQIQSLKKQYGGVTVLNIPELAIPQSQCFGLVGNNGAGKTTLLRLMLDLIRATGGTVSIEGHEVSRTEIWKRTTGSYLDENMLFGFLTPEEYFDVLRSVYDLSEEDLNLHHARFEEFYSGEILGKKKYIRDLSKGNKKKVGISAAFFGNPQMIILDEPFENLDPSTQIRLKKLVGREKEEKNTTFVISSHDLDQVTEISDRIVLLEKGIIRHDITGTRQERVDALRAYFGSGT